MEETKIAHCKTKIANCKSNIANCIQSTTIIYLQYLIN